MLAGSDISVYATVGSTSILTFPDIFKTTICFQNGKQISLSKSKYHIALSKTFIEIKIINVTANDTGEYKVYDPLGFRPGLDLYVSNMSCPFRARRQDCAIEGSSPMLTFLTDWSLCHSDNEVDFLKRKNIHKTDNINLDLHIYNVTPTDEGYYICFPRLSQTEVVLKVAKLGFINQTDMKTIGGQEGREMTITCYSDTEQYITALQLESNGTGIALGDNQTVDITFIPDRTDHLSMYKCVDIIQSAITIEVQLIVTCLPVFPPENRNVQTGQLGQSMTLSFYIYSYPPVEDIFIEQIGRKQIKRKKIDNFIIMTSILSYTEFANVVGIEGYEILIEIEKLDIDDFQSYRITASNRFGESNYYFVIMDNERLPLSKSKRTYFVILCSVAVILLVYIIISHVCFCVKHDITMGQRNNHVSEDHNDQTYDLKKVQSHTVLSTTYVNRTPTTIMTESTP
ncbi:unnamed protein product [Mytilus coruscus]|uniref:Ig-like domain-containing protein n=1 Tax=Mytilus coruscus TaxID=42192 RepID=A0A6J8BGL0_MYTCO|nr:unnamed protein product [Mytilus coruscus]